ncbi:hypothetical protein [Anaeromicropila populeti]|uniref:Uncharacterized protein n=1 Tax=Anaeromicropila populeti TaxID=37658 RepID=A0A1I6LWW3_9FIRM|nr:hypothetical protein [Anaeromicropila populeti]SFS07961.1 hypothetical protein SAMN05661086_03633 [Anaeromicropila populeti]
MKQSLSEKEKKILDTFIEVFPTLSEGEKDRLLWAAEGMLMQSKLKKNNKC